jgi:hypothetical protein
MKVSDDDVVVLKDEAFDQSLNKYFDHFRFIL